MATGFLSPIGNSAVPFLTNQGVVLAGGQLFTYLAGTTTPSATYTTSALSVANPNPIILGSNGLPPQEIWLQQGSTYKFLLEDANSNVIATYDNISGINDISNQSTPSEWIISPVTPTYVSGTQFTLPGNLTTTFAAGRRIYASISAGTVYGRITSSSFSVATTTVNVLWDSGALDSGLTAVAYALLNPTNPSIPDTNVSLATVSAAKVVIVYPGSGLYSGVLQLVGQSSYAPTMRSNGSLSQIEFINNANNLVTMLLTDAGNMTIAGTLTQLSDESLKADWQELPEDFVDRLASVRSGTYTRVATGVREVGVGAQSLQPLLPEAVAGEEKLSVAYGNAALVACIELAKEVVRLRELVENK